VNLGNKEKVRGTIPRVVPSVLNRTFRGDAVVVYDNPSERIVGGASR